MLRAVWWCALLSLVGARVYERCELARDLLRAGAPRAHLATWVCIAYHESRYDTAANNPHSGDHGILQISELYWCGPGKACGRSCSEFRDDDITDDVQCALQIYEEHTRLQGNGFLAWVVYPHHCKHNTKKYLADCDVAFRDSTERISKTRGRNKNDFEYYPKIDELKPPYLSIKTILQNKGNDIFDDSKSGQINWLHFKIDNIDELKLPVFKSGQNSDVDLPFLRSTIFSSTSTTSAPESSTFINSVRPPMPRRIETNQFRRKFTTTTEVNAVHVTDLKIPSTDEQPTFQKNPPPGSSFSAVYSTPAVSSNVFSNFTRTTSIRPEIESTTLTRNRFSFTSTTLAPVSLTNYDKVHRGRSRSRFSNPTTILPAASLDTNATTSSWITRSKSRFSSPSTTSTTPSRLTNPSADSYYVDPFGKTTRAPVPRSRYRFGSAYSTVAPSLETSATNKFEWTTQKPFTSTIYPRFSFTTTTPAPVNKASSTTAWSVSRNGPRRLTYFDTTSTTKPPGTTNDFFSQLSNTRTQQAISKSNYITFTTSPRPLITSTNSYGKDRPKVTERTTPSTILSVFDVYLGTRRSTLPTYSFAPVSNKFKLQIFSDGTTPVPSVKKSSDPKTPGEGAERNYVRRQLNQ